MVALSRPARGWEFVRYAIVAILLGPGLVANPSLVPPHSDRSATPAAVPRAVPRPLQLATFISSNGTVLDPQVPFTLHADVAGGLPPLEFLWKSPTLGTCTAENWTIRLDAGVNASVGLEVADSAGELAAANASFSVAPPLRATLGVSPASLDAGGVVPVDVQVAGGVPPFQLQWSLVDGVASGSATFGSSGSWVVPVPVNTSGTTWIRAEVSDAVGGSVFAAEPFPAVFATPEVVGNVAPDPAEVGQPVTVRGEVIGGAPPVQWTVDALGPVANGSASQGILDASDRFGWTGVATGPGNLSFAIRSTDASGANTSLLLAVPVIAGVHAVVSVNGTPRNGTPIELVASIWGGEPPYQYLLTTTDGQQASGALGNAGFVNSTVLISAAGPFGVTLTVHDALGFATQSLALVRVPGGSDGGAVRAGPPPDDLATLAIVAGLASAATLAAVFLWHRRRRAAGADPAHPPSEGDVLARLLAPHGTLDRSTLESMADEEGIHPDRLDVLIETAVRAGRARVTDDPGGEQITWVDAVRGSTDPPGEGAADAGGEA
ncbi:MAG TPA: hypothetical protein VEY07_08215 [Thermoplasmata archaeon]|nr:hypothetical protein [Thermoplasmata archaeon]